MIKYIDIAVKCRDQVEKRKEHSEFTLLKCLISSYCRVDMTFCHLKLE